MITVELNPEQYAEKCRVLADKGVVLTGTSGTVVGRGCTVAYNYDGKGLLTISILSAPFGTKNIVEGHIRQWLGVA